MGKGRTTVIVVGVLAVVLLLAAVAGLGGGAAWLLARDGSGADASRESESSHIGAIVGLGGGGALFVRGSGIGAPLTVARVDLDGADVREAWRWQAPRGYGNDAMLWQRGGEIGVGELHPTESTGGTRRLVAFHLGRGPLGEVPAVERGAWLVSDDGAAILARTPDALSSYATTPTLRPVWTTPIPPDTFVARLALTPSFAVVYHGAMRVFRRTDGSLVREIPERVVAGIDAVRGEVLWLREGRIVVESLETGIERLVLDLGAGAAIVDGMEEPSLLGSHAGKWIFVHSTTLDHSFSSTGGPPWVRNGARTLTAVDPASGAVAWRLDLGPWPRWAPFFHQRVYDQSELPASILLYSDGDVEGGGSVEGHLAYVSLTDGTLRWQVTYPHATRGNALWHAAGDSAFLRIREPGEGSRSALARFEAGRLTGAVWLPDFGGDPRAPMLLPEEAWLLNGDGGWALVSGPRLTPRAQTPGKPPPTAALDFVRSRVQLPGSAL